MSVTTHSEPPQITVPQDQEVSVREGELVVLHCDADGAPSPHLAWLKDGHLVTSPRLYVDEYGLRLVVFTELGHIRKYPAQNLE